LNRRRFETSTPQFAQILGIFGVVSVTVGIAKIPEEGSAAPPHDRLDSEGFYPQID
jgi:hypothetical protein